MTDKDIAWKSELDQVESNLSSHENDSSNPHNVTASQVGAASDSHDHNGDTLKPESIEIDENVSETINYNYLYGWDTQYQRIDECSVMVVEVMDFDNVFVVELGGLPSNRSTSMSVLFMTQYGGAEFDIDSHWSIDLLMDETSFSLDAAGDAVECVFRTYGNSVVIGSVVGEYSNYPV